MIKYLTGRSGRMKTIYNTKEEVLIRAKEAIGVPFGEIDSSNRLSKLGNKGGIGQVMEEGHFGYTPNSKAEPDFKDAGVELKVTPYRRNHDNSISAKERLVLNIIDYMSEYACVFEESAFWHKNKCILMMIYEYLPDIDKEDFSISNTFIFEYPEEDLAVIKSDWERIKEKIRNGLAHDLSEGDTLYLGACTKGASAATLREQPFSNIKAKQRAYSLKQSYMTGILRRFIFGSEQNERIIQNINDIKNSTFEAMVISRLSPYFGRTRLSLIEEYDLNDKSKDANERIIAAVLGVQGKVSQTAEFQMANITPKTVRLRYDGSIQENMSFKAFRAKELLNQEWENSDLKELFETTKFMFIIFRSIDEHSSNQIFQGAIFWNMPQQDLDEVERVWRMTVDVIKKGVRFTKKNGRIYNNLPKSTESPIAHVRPHARDREDFDELPDGRLMTKQCFWLKRTYIENILNDSAARTDENHV